MIFERRILSHICSAADILRSQDFTIFNLAESLPDEFQSLVEDRTIAQRLNIEGEWSIITVIDLVSQLCGLYLRCELKH